MLESFKNRPINNKSPSESSPPTLRMGSTAKNLSTSGKILEETSSGN